MSNKVKIILVIDGRCIALEGEELELDPEEGKTVRIQAAAVINAKNEQAEAEDLANE
jgi:hypothetical protein